MAEAEGLASSGSCSTLEAVCGFPGLQSVVLYSLPELDGAIDTVPLGGDFRLKP